MLALLILSVILLFTSACFAVGSVMQRRRTKEFTDYAEHLAKVARARSGMRTVD